MTPKKGGRFPVVIIRDPYVGRFQHESEINVIISYVNVWCTYDIWSGAYNGLLTHIPILVFTVVGMLVHDAKHKEKN